MDWCVNPFSGANHAPLVKVSPSLNRTVKSGSTVKVDASQSFDPDGNSLSLQPIFYLEPGTFRGDVPQIKIVNKLVMKFRAPQVTQTTTLHLLVILKDNGTPSLTGYRRVVFTIEP
jgi:hypothetical protein